MALRFDANADVLTRTTNLPPIANFTLMCWVNRVGTGAANYETVMGIGNATAQYAFYVVHNNVLRFNLTNWTNDYNGSATVNNTWYHLAMVCDGTGVGNLRGYRNGVLEITGNGDATIVAGTLRINAGPAGTADWANMRVAAVKVYSVALTANEIATEARSYRPVRLANLNTWLPCVHPTAASNNVDFSGVGGNLTAAGTLTVEDGPPIRWATRPQPRRLRAGAAATILFPSVSDTLLAVDGGVSATRGLLTAINVSDSLTLVDGGVTVERWVPVPNVFVVIQTGGVSTLAPNVSDVLTVVDSSVTTQFSLFLITAQESVTTVDAGTATNLTPLFLTASETVISIDAGVNAAVVFGLSTSVQDVATVSDVLPPLFKLSVFNIAATDSLTIIDAGTTPLLPSLVRLVTASDTLTVLDAGATVRLTHEIQDSFTVVDAGVTVRLAGALAVTPTPESLTLIDVAPAAVLQPLRLSASDLLMVIDGGSTAQLVQGLSITASDLLTLVDVAVSVQINPLLVGVSESLTVADAGAFVFSPLLFIIATETLTLADANISALLQPLQLSTSDLLSVSDGGATAILQPLRLSVSEASTVVDAGASAQLVQVLRPSASDVLTVVDVGSVVQERTLLIGVAESVTLVEAPPTLRFSKLLIQSTESLTVSEFANVFRYQAFYTIAVSDTITLADLRTVHIGLPVIGVPTLRATAEVRDLTKTLEIPLDAVTAQVRNLMHVMELRQMTASAELRNLLKTLEVAIASVTADVRDLSKTA